MTQTLDFKEYAEEQIPPEARPVLPKATLPTPPRPGTLWTRFMILAFIFLGFVLVDHLTQTLLDFWLLQDMGYDSVFWTNFRMAIVLFAVAAVTLFAAIAGPAYAHPLSKDVRRRFVYMGVFAAVVGGMYFSGQNKTYLLFFGSKPWGKTDPVFGYDLSFYIFRLPAIQRTMVMATLVGLIALVCSLICARISRPNIAPPEGMGRIARTIGPLASWSARTAFGFVAATLAIRVWLERYGLLLDANQNPEVDDPRRPDAAVSIVPQGADFIDVNGFFSTLNSLWVEILAIVFMAAGVILLLTILHRTTTQPNPPADWKRRLRLAAWGMALLPGITLDYSFKGFIYLRQLTSVAPNEPPIQLPYLKRHIDATNEAWGLDKVQKVPFRPKAEGDPLPSVDALLADPALKNAPLWPGWAAWLEEQPDPEYIERIFLAEDLFEPNRIYSPTLDVFNQQQRLRPYYGIVDVDWVRYKIGGEDRLYASGAREILLDAAEGIFIAWWGQQFLLFTHGHGLVMAPSNATDAQGLPTLSSRGIPSTVTEPELQVENEAIYFGEGTGATAFSNLQEINEFDRTSEQGRVETRYPPEVDSGVNMDSALKRLAFAWKSRQFFEIVFSDLITSDTRAHYARTPLDRLKRVAPFLFYDSDPYAVAANDRINWMVNGLTTTNMYPYSREMDLGDKAFRRTPMPSERVWVNYARDSVKATIDGYTGETKLYKFTDEPIINTWSGIYPDLFVDRAQMPPALREQVQYPPQLFHAQFDDLYILYHMTDPIQFFNVEDPLDDGDEVLGPLILSGRAITFSMEPYYWMASPSGVMPASTEPTQFAMSMIFTPDGAMNVRSIVTAYMNGEDYGKLHELSVPKGEFFIGPEQADAAIDQDAFISQQISLWNRLGLSVIRGHTTPLVVQDELIYVEPIFIMSEQNPVPQLKRVAVVFRGRAALGETLEEALRNAINPPPTFPVRPGPELGGEPGFIRPTGQEGFQEQPRVGGVQPALPRDPSQVPR